MDSLQCLEDERSQSVRKPAPISCTAEEEGFGVAIAFCAVNTVQVARVRAVFLDIKSANCVLINVNLWCGKVNRNRKTSVN